MGVCDDRRVLAELLKAWPKGRSPELEGEPLPGARMVDED